MKNIKTIYEQTGNWHIEYSRNNADYSEVINLLNSAYGRDFAGTINDFYGVVNGEMRGLNIRSGEEFTAEQVLAMLEDLPKEGETVEVRDGVGEAWMEAVFYTKINHGSYPYIAQSSGANYPVAWRDMRRKQEVLEVIVKKNGKQVDASCISEETWANLRKA